MQTADTLEIVALLLKKFQRAKKGFDREERHDDEALADTIEQY